MEISTGTPQFTINKHSKWIHSLAITSDERYLVTSSTDEVAEKSALGTPKNKYTSKFKFLIKNGSVLIYLVPQKYKHV